MERELLRLILNNKFFEENKHFITKEFFPTNLYDLYKLVCEAHEKHHKDLTISELKELYYAVHPTLTKSNKEALCLVIDNLPKEISDEVAKEIVQKKYKTELGRQLANVGISIVNGKEEGQIEKAAEIIEVYTSGKMYNVSSIELDPVTTDIEEILNEVSVTTRWNFNLTGLRIVASGVGPGIFTIIVARTEVGKTASWVSLCCGPDGFAYQGARINAYLNEETGTRVQVRAVSAFTGMTLSELVAEPKKAQKMYDKIKDRVNLYNVKGRSIDELEAHIDKTRPDITVFDQMDKVNISGNFTREDQRLGALYIRTREIADRYGNAAFAITQASANADGKTFIGSADAADSRTAKAAEADLMLGIGKRPMHDDETRIINIIKNKIHSGNGNHTDVICRIQPSLSRYVE